MGTAMRDILLTTATMLVLTGGFARAASTNDEMFANAALRELHNLAVASAQSEFCQGRKWQKIGREKQARPAVRPHRDGASPRAGSSRKATQGDAGRSTASRPHAS